MLRKAGLLSVVCLSLFSHFASADIAAIYAASLPKENGVQDSLKDATELEPYSHVWTSNWKYPIAKSEAAARLGRDLFALNAAVKGHPDNAELLLLTGLVARYAYNLDVPGSYDSSIAALAEAAKLQPRDVRAPWFRAALLCGTDTPKAGAEDFLKIEGSGPWEQLPASFWNDYVECASVTNMPAHVLRANDRLERLHAPASNDRDFLIGTAQKRFDPFDPKKEYAPKEAWAFADEGKTIAFTSTSCGVRMHVRSDWSVDQLALTKGSCVADFSAGPYKQTASKRRPSILMMAQQPGEGVTLEEYSKRFLVDGSFEVFTPSRCPVDRCISMKGRKPGAYGKDGDGHGLMVFFEREQPEFPGLVFEWPMDPPKLQSGLKFYRPSQTQQRIPGKLYYVVLLDTAASIEGPAMQDFDFFLQGLTVE